MSPTAENGLLKFPKQKFSFLKKLFMYIIKINCYDRLESQVKDRCIPLFIYGFNFFVLLLLFFRCYGILFF